MIMLVLLLREIKNVKIQHLDFLLFVCLIFISAFRDSEDLYRLQLRTYRVTCRPQENLDLKVILHRYLSKYKAILGILEKSYLLKFIKTLDDFRMTLG